MMSHFCNNWFPLPFRRERISFALRTVILIVLVSLTQTALDAQSRVKPGSGSRADGQGRKFVNKIPYDVFFENPLEVVNSNKSQVAAPETPAETTSRSQPASTPISPSNPKSGEIVWQEILPMEELQSEIKTVRSSLTKSMSNQGSYNSNFKAIAIDGTELAALAGIVQQHSGTLTWKDKSAYVRDFGAQVSLAATGLGKENFEKTRSAFEKAKSVLDGSVPADAGEVIPTRPFHEFAARKGLMRRIERAKDWLKQDVNTEAKFKSMSTQVQHEAAVLTALATIITTLGYEHTDDADYQEHARLLIDGALEALSASKDEAYDRYRQSIDKVNKSCTDCHASFGNG